MSLFLRSFLAKVFLQDFARIIKNLFIENLVDFSKESL